MPNFSVDQLRKMMDRHSNIRNLSVIAHVDHGKSTLTDSLIGKAGIIAEARQGEARFMDTRDDEQARSITIKSTCVSLFYERMEGDEGKQEKVPYLINLIDSPGHVDFSSEVTAALRVTDGALVVVCATEGVCVQTETVLRQAIAERIKPVLFLNKLDRTFLELQCTMEEGYKNFRNSIEAVNVIVETYRDEKLGDISVNPSGGKVGFGSGLHAWGFTLWTFAHMYANKFGMSAERLMKKFWGDNYWSPAENKWVRKNPGNKLERGFCQFVLKPIKTIMDALMNKKKEIYEPVQAALNIVLPKKERDLIGKPLMKVFMRTWLPAGEALLDMIADHLPSPAEAQGYRTENLYSGPLDSEDAESLRKCDPEGPVCLYVSKMVPTSEKGRFIAFGRVFSGTVATGQTIRILGPDYEHGKKKDLYVKKVQRVLLMMGRYVEQLDSCPAGNMCGLVGIDQYLLKSGTLTTSETMHPIVTMKFSVSAVVQVAVSCRNAQDLPKLVEGLKRLSKSDPLVKCSHSKTGEHIIAGAGELHLEICLKDLQEQYLKGASINISEPVVSFAETLTTETGADGEKPRICVSKSPNKHNRLYVWGNPLGEELCQAIDQGDIAPGQDFKIRARKLADDFEWDVGEARKIWTFGCPPDALGNMVVDCAKGVQFLNEIKDHVVNAFMNFTGEGPLCGDVLRGCRFNIDDVTLHADTIHRGAGQIMPAARKVFIACLLAGTPKLMEPYYIVDIIVPTMAVSGVYSTLNARRGEVHSMEERPGTPLTQIKGYLPVLESFGFVALLRKNTGGQAFPQLKFSHWGLMSGDPMDEEDTKESNAYQQIMSSRKRKGLKMALPKFTDYYDRI